MCQKIYFLIFNPWGPWGMDLGGTPGPPWTSWRAPGSACTCADLGFPVGGRTRLLTACTPLRLRAARWGGSPHRRLDTGQGGGGQWSPAPWAEG